MQHKTSIPGVPGWLYTFHDHTCTTTPYHPLAPSSISTLGFQAVNLAKMAFCFYPSCLIPTVELSFVLALKNEQKKMYFYFAAGSFLQHGLFPIIMGWMGTEDFLLFSQTSFSSRYFSISPQIGFVEVARIETYLMREN